MSKKKAIHRVTKDDLLNLLNKTDFQILFEVNRSDFGFVQFLQERKYAEDCDKNQIIEIVLEILSRVCSIVRLSQKASANRLLRMLQDCQQFLFDDVSRLIHSCIAETQNVNLIMIISNYMNVLKVLLKKDYFPCEKILNEIFPALENYMNRLRERKLTNLEKVEESFKFLRMEVRKREDPEDLQDVDDDELDIRNFRLLPIVPRSNDIVNYEIYNIPQNIIDRSYKSVDHYLSVHYRLMREDMLRTFRDCIKTVISPYGRQRSSELANVYENVIVGFPPKYSHRGISYKIKITVSKEIDWSKKGTLIPGSLVFFTPDECNSVVFATVDSNPNVSRSKSKECKLEVKLEDDSYNDELSKTALYKMIEPSAFFECYRHVLSAIKEFSEATLPFCDVLAYLDYSDSKPEYLYEKQKYCLHEKCDYVDGSNDKCSCKEFNLLKDDEWPISDDLKLNAQQYDAFKIALRKKVAVIQGPPGTGKTYVGEKVVRALLMNRNKPYKPIIICCLTNHALDQFLERMLEHTKKIIRLGSQGKKEVIDPHKIENMIYAIKQVSPEGEVPEILQKSYNLVKKIAPHVLKMNVIEAADEELMQVQSLSNNINNYLDLYVSCEEKYLEETALNEIIDSKYKDQLRITSGSIPKSLSAAVMEWLLCSRSSDLYHKCRKMFYEIRKRETKMSFKNHFNNIWDVSERKRFELFYYWRKTCLTIIEKGLDRCIEEYKRIMRNFKYKKSDPIKQELLRKADIIGVTTTGACKYKDLINLSEPQIIVIEEAAQVLEAHVIASLTRSIHHLILIGDHEQLRPLPANHELSERYNLKVSMFERLFINGAPSVTLVQQHRMKPCIAELLVPTPYKEYVSGQNVHEYEEIIGVGSSVFFFDHCEYEDQNSSGMSSSNDFEAQMVVALAKYFVLCMYSFKQITILATYAAQFNLIRKYLLEQKLDEIYVTTVDNFQGEESDIILLSFVRSNPSAIGFLKESNRVCVALSRAKKGMFCFGNFQLFADKNDLWKDIVEKLRVKNMIGNALPLKCYRHDTVHSAKSANDIYDFLSGGCSEICNFLLECGHKCTHKCHFKDPDHLHYLCKQPCEKMIDETRVCPRLCFERCKKSKKQYIELPCGHRSSRIDSICVEEVPKRLPCNHLVTIPCHINSKNYSCKALVSIKLDCGHKKSIWCYQQQENGKFLCTDLRKQLGPCGHTVEVPCGINFEDNELLPFCNKACEILLNCGHPCVRLCRYCFETGIHGFCSEKCELILSCGHKCDGFCGSPCPPCSKKCFVSCGHGTHCINDCLRSCVKCLKPCERKCRHKSCSKLCFDNCNVDPCMERCTEKLPCQHRCLGFCGDPCPCLCRDCNPGDLKENDSGTNLYVELECEHVIEANDLEEHIDNCLMSFEWPCCLHCSSPITKSVRYKRKLQQAKSDCIESCETTEENKRVLYLVESMYGQCGIVPAPFLPVHKKIIQFLKRGNLRGDALMVLKNCVMMLKKLIIIEPKLNKNYDEYIQGKFDTLLLWIDCHLTQASFQQLEELEKAVIELAEDVTCRSRLRVIN